MRFTFVSILLFALSFQGFSQKKFYRNELGFRSDNDAYLATKQDRYYTNGLFIQFRQVVNQPKNTLNKKIWGVNLGHEMYNARSGQITAIAAVDRPFASYLYGSGSLQWLKPNENSIKAELQIGVVGPSALGKEVQTLLHQTFGFYEVSGWQYQVNDEVGVNAKINMHYFLMRNKSKNLDLSLPVNISVGNTFSGLNAGLLLRTGDLNPFYQSALTGSIISNKTEQRTNESEFYFFLKPSLTYVVYDATIQGGLFVKDKGPVIFKPNPIVFAQQIGTTYANKQWTFDLSVIFNSKRLSEAQRTEQYASVAVFRRF